MSITNIPFLDVFAIVGIIAVVVFFLVIAICLTSGHKSAYEQKIDDDNQMEYISEQNRKRKERKK